MSSSSPSPSSTTTPTPSLPTTLLTTTSLIEQFLTSLSSNQPTHQQPPPSTADTPSPLVLLDAASKSLKSQVTKLSLITVTAPFTPTAAISCLQPLNTSVLPSLVTATFLTNPEVFSASFSAECTALTRRCLRDLLVLVRLVEVRNNSGNGNKKVSEAEKNEVTAAVGRVWESVDEVVRFAEGGFVGFVARKAGQWLELMKDAVRELQEWDPEEEVDEMGDFFGDVGSDEDDQQQEEDGKKSTDRATISAGVKDQALKVLSRIPQSVHVVLKQRLEKVKNPQGGDLPAQTRLQLEQILKRIRNVSEMIDESAEGMYMGDLELCLKKAGEARATTIDIVEAVLTPLIQSQANGTTGESKEDKYIQRALDWIKQVGVNSSTPKTPSQ